MNFVSKFDGGPSVWGFSPKAQTHVDTVTTKAPVDAIVVQDAHLLFTGDFKRTGVDLVITKDDHELVLADYFKGEKRAPLASTDGAYLTGKIVDALTGHVQTAQADGSASAAKIIGHVTKLTGTATAIRNGVSIILNNGDNVYQGDVVQSGSDSSLGITFIDGSVFGLAANAKMVLSEMIYDPNGSSNSSLLSLVQGTISFVAGATAKHGDMKVDTPVATMGIRGTAVLVEIDFDVSQAGSAPPARFQVLVEPDGTTGSYVLLDRTTLAPIATVNQAGTVTSVSGQGVVSFLASAQLSPEAMKLINEVFTQKFTDNSNPRSDTHFTDAPVPSTTFPIKLANGDTVNATVHFANVQDKPSGPSAGPNSPHDHIPGPPQVATFDEALSERLLLTGSSLIDTVSSHVNYLDINAGDIPSVTIAFNHFAYSDSAGHDITASLTPEQLAAINAVTVPLVVVQDPNQKNFGSATWTYSVPDHAFDFLAEGETLTLTYMARVDNNFALNNETTYAPFTITITGTNDVPTISATNGAFTELLGTGNSTIDHAGGTITFADVDLTDRPTVSAAFSSFTYQDAQHHDVTASLTQEQLTAITGVEAALTLTPAADNTHNGTVAWSYDVADSAFDFLASGETLTLTYIATVDDHHGGVVTVPVTVTITGTNDVPTIETTSASFDELANPQQPNPTGSTTLDTVAGTITFTDVDLTDRPVASAEFTSFTYTDASNHALTLTAAQQAAIVAVEVPLTVTQTAGNTHDGTASWTYSAPDGAFDFLADGEVLTLTYTATVDDGHGGVVTAPITITVTGTNDTPAITSGSQTAAIQELADTHGSTTPDIANGTVTFTDPDLTDTHTVTITGVSATGTTTGLADNATALKWLSLDAFSDSIDGATGSQAWSFSAEDHYFDYLAAGEQVTLTYMVQVDDGHGGVITTPVEITITGTNDAPAITSATSDSFSEQSSLTQPNPTGSSAADTAAGTISFTDLDLSDRPVVSASFASYSYTDAANHSHTLTPAQEAAVEVALTVTQTAGNTNDGSASWSYSAPDSAFDFLGEGDTLVLTYNASVYDGHTTVTTPFTVTVHGSNDTPTITSAAQSAIIEIHDDGGPPHPQDTAGGTVTFTDVDLTDGHTVTITGVTATGTTTGLPSNATMLSWMSLGTLTDSSGGATGSQAWTFSAADTSFHYLGEGQQVTLTYTVEVDDGHGGLATQTVSVTMTDADGAGPTVHIAAAPVFTTLNVPGASDAQALGINDGGTIVGQAGDAGQQVGWTYDGSSFTTLVAPDDHSAQTTGAHGINDLGTVVGDYSPLASTPLYGFNYDGSHFTQIVSDTQGSSTSANGINDAGVIVGSAYLHPGTDYAAYIDDQGNFTYFSMPGADNPNGDTFANDINNLGQIVGSYNPDASDPNGYLGYLYDNGTFTTIADPLGEHGTRALGLNDHGQVVGYYVDGAGIEHGFVESGGIYTTIDDPLGVHGTVVTGINNAGQIVGYYLDGSDASHPFESSVVSTVTAENTPLVLSQVSVSAPEVPDSSTIEVTIGVQHGTLALNGSTGLSTSFDAGHDTMTITGTVADIDAALMQGLIYTPTAGYNGSDTLTVIADDLGHNASGTSLSTSQTLDLAVVHAETGTIQADTIASTAANDFMTGGAGADNFVFSPNFGHDTIADFKPGTDSITFDHATFADVAAVLAATHDDGHGNTVITLDASDSITLDHVLKSQLVANQSDFHFV